MRSIGFLARRLTHYSDKLARISGYIPMGQCVRKECVINGRFDRVVPFLQACLFPGIHKTCLYGALVLQNESDCYLRALFYDTYECVVTNCGSFSTCHDQ
jgi:hypothetical protein